MIDLRDKLILVTGASGGIGRAISQKVAACGSRVILFGRDKRRLQETLNSLTGNGHGQFKLDITDYPLISDTIKEIVEKFGTIDGFVNCAGIEKTIPFNISKPSVFKEIFEINVFAGFELARNITQKNNFSHTGASFIFISSVMAKLGEQGKIAYCASKSALSSGIKAMAFELAAKKIRCNCVLPGIVKTDMTSRLFESLDDDLKEKIIIKHPLGIGEANDIASLVVFLLSDESKWITGAEYVIDGGYSIH